MQSADNAHFIEEVTNDHNGIRVYMYVWFKKLFNFYYYLLIHCCFLSQVIKQARDLHNVSSAPPTILPEYKLWEEHWCRCSRELGQWEILNEFGKSQDGASPFLGGLCVFIL